MGRRAVTSPGKTRNLLDVGGAPSIAEQVRLSLVADEEVRCLELERKRGKRVTRRTIDTPKVRVGPHALCQNVDFLERVTQFDYQLTRADFCEYAERRGVLCLAGVRGSRRWQVFANHQTSHAAYLADPYFQVAQEHEGARHRYSPEEMEANWRVIGFGRAVLQDCWELFLSRAREPRSNAYAPLAP